MKASDLGAGSLELGLSRPPRRDGPPAAESVLESGSEAGRRGSPSEPGDELPGQGCSTGRRELMRPLR